MIRTQLVSIGLISGAVLPACGVFHPTSGQEARVTTSTGSAGTATSCPVPVADLAMLRARSKFETGTLSVHDPRIASAYQSKDPRNYTLQVSGEDLTQANVGLQGSFSDASQRYDVVVSHGDFDISKYAGSAPGTAAISPGLKPLHANVAYVIVDAVTGVYKGQELKLPGCTREG